MSAGSTNRLSLPAKARLAAEVDGTYRRAKALMRDNDLPATLEALRAGAHPDASTPPLPYDDALRLGRAVVRTLTVLPADSRCLMRSVVLTGLLARRRTNGQLVIGVKPGVDFGAHAWVELQGRPLLSPGDGSYERLVEL